MKYRALGKSGIVVSEIGFGAWGIGGGAYGSVDPKDSLAALNLAFDRGVTFYDTSNIYGSGRSEELIAEAFKGRMDKIVLATKGGTLPHSGFEMPQDFSVGNLRKSLEASLKRLGVDRVDLYQLHSPPREFYDSADEVFAFLASLKKEGKIREYGVSARSPGDAKLAVEKYSVPVIQANFNLIDQRAVETGLYALAEKTGVGVICRTPLVFGFLTKQISGETKFEAGDHRANWPKDQLDRWTESAGLFDFLQKNRTAVQAALRFCLDQRAVSVVIPGMLSVAHVEENTAASDVPSLSAEELARVDEIYRTHDFYDKGAKARGKQK